MLLSALVLCAAAWLRSAEYDEQYTLFLTAGSPRPAWPETAFPAGLIVAVQSGHATLAEIARELRSTDVHPPLYFWAVAWWRDLFGPSLLAVRLLSVLSALISLGLVAAIARHCAIAPAVPMLLTLGCYGYVYTSSIARGFAPAQTLLLLGVALLLARRPVLAGASFGAAFCCNYLAVFVAAAAIAAAGAWLAALSSLPFLAVDLWFFIAQHSTRLGQFPPFSIGPDLRRLAGYQIAAVFGGLPLYVSGIEQLVVGAIVGVATLGLVVVVARTQPWKEDLAARIMLAAAIAPAAGLLLLGVAFDNSPIELRYLSFGLPLIALLVARSSTSRAGRGQSAWLHRMLLPLVFGVQFAGIVGFLCSPRTMQPARAAAQEAARLVGDGIVLLPRGNDGVGIVGAFGVEAPAALPLLLVRPSDPILRRIAPYHRVAIAMLAQDRESALTIAALRSAFTSPAWHLAATGSNLEVYERNPIGE